MSRVFVDRNLDSWQIYPSTGAFGLPQQPKLVFLSLSDPAPASRGRYVVLSDTDEATAEEVVSTASHAHLLELLDRSKELD